MAAVSRTTRRFIAGLLFNEGPLNTAAIQDRVRERCRAKDVPSLVAISGALRPPIFIVLSMEKIESFSGKKECSVVGINTNLIYNIEDIPYGLAYSHLFGSERRRAIRCKRCNQRRLMQRGRDVCLRCQRMTVDI